MKRIFKIILLIIVLLMVLVALMPLFFQFNFHDPIVHRRVSECDSIIIAAGPKYKANKFREVMLGENYRASWVTKVKVPCIDINNFAGGLNIKKAGGGMQTRSLRLTDSNGIEYMLRSVNKDPSPIVHRFFHGTFIDDVAQDMMSAAHPYGALVVPELARAAGLYYTHPKLVYLPDNEKLKFYRPDFGGMLATIEVRPDDDLTAFSRFGNATDADATQTLYKHLQRSHWNRVDQQMFARARLFDMYINDWDRHEDQWRWATFGTDTSIFFKPVARDRDQVFVKFEGVLPGITKLLPFSDQKMNDFEDHIENFRSLTKNARYIDRLLLNEVTREEWIAIAKQLEQQLTPDVINNAVRQLPPEVYNISGEELARILLERRSLLVELAKMQYEQLNDEVHIAFSDRSEKVVISENESGHLIIKVFPLNRPEVLYSRAFFPRETDVVTVHLYGGKHFIEVKMENELPILVNVLTGRGEVKVSPEAPDGLTLLPDSSFIYQTSVNGSW